MVKYIITTQMNDDDDDHDDNFINYRKENMK